MRIICQMLFNRKSEVRELLGVLVLLVLAGFPIPFWIFSKLYPHHNNWCILWLSSAVSRPDPSSIGVLTIFVLATIWIEGVVHSSYSRFCLVKRIIQKWWFINSLTYSHEVLNKRSVHFCYFLQCNLIMCDLTSRLQYLAGDTQLGGKVHS